MVPSCAIVNLNLKMKLLRALWCLPLLQGAAALLSAAEINLLAFGDWGDNNTPVQAATARRMADDGLTQLFVDAGAMLLPPGCGPCAGGMMAPLGPGEVSVATAATNHAGRFGSNDAEIYLASPLTVAASAVAGCLADPGTLSSRPTEGGVR